MQVHRPMSTHKQSRQCVDGSWVDGSNESFFLDG